ncbi:MAG: hypothetical protein JWQ98_824 [Chlorobi bacterium]|nr:hypothetical protein [Chlorobiota bacterium]
MDEDYPALFMKYDDPVHLEFPRGFDRADANARFNEFAAELSRRSHAEYETETGLYIQDASFHSQIHLPDGRLRFSSFGEMIAFTPDHEVPPPLVDIIRDLARERGYLLVPTEVLETSYVNVKPAFSGIESWWIRFFDWL